MKRHEESYSPREGGAYAKDNVMRRDMGLYVHIPFCTRKCSYCDFLSFPAPSSEIKQYVSAVERELQWASSCLKEYVVRTIFIGGGTPTVLSISDMERISYAIRGCFSVSHDVEWTVEANPGTLDMEKLSAYRQFGVNRLSIGLQAANDRELAYLGRIHTVHDFMCSYENARKAGFENINVDLISSIPGQSVDSWEQTLKTVIALSPEHISAYSLIVEEGTPFYKAYADGSRDMAALPPLPDEEEELKIDRSTESLLEQAGYSRYEISNYAKKGYECRHNIGYWRRIPYYGAGLGASSCIRECRFKNTDDAARYLRRLDSSGNQLDTAGADQDLLQKGFRAGCRYRIFEQIEPLCPQEQMKEMMILGLRMTEGVSEARFRQYFQADIYDVFSREIDGLMRRGLLCRESGRLYMTKEGMRLGNNVFMEFL